mgnify:CR=1 FL=1
MKLLVIGSGGREHAMAWRLAQTRGQPMSPEQERMLIDRGWRR